MYQKFRKWGSALMIIVLLPYIITVFLNGPVKVTSSSIEETEMYVETENGQVLMSMKDIGIGILAKEMPADFEKEALKAQAVLERTRLYKEIRESQENKLTKEDFWTVKEMEEAFGSAEFISRQRTLNMAWEETEGQVLTYEGELALTPFFYLSNGSTRDGKEALGEEYPYLKIVDCPLDIESVEQLQTVTVDMMDAEILKTDTTGYVLSVRVGEEKINGEEFRTTYGLASSCFVLQEYENKLRITTRGVGHGVGMSQNTANEMAKSGKGHTEILKYFYPGTEIKEVAEIIQKEDSLKKKE